MRLAIINHAVRRIYIYSTTFYKSLHWNITGFIELIMAFGINSTKYCNFSVPVYCTDQVSSFLFTNQRFKKEIWLLEHRKNPVRTLEKLEFKHEKAIVDLDFLISCRKNSFFPKFLQFKVSNKQLRASKAYISCQNVY